MKVPITRTFFDQRDFELVLEPLRNGWIAQGAFVEQLEDRFSKYVGAPHAIAVTSGTSALHLAMVALDIGPGDEVLVPAFTWIATANAVEYVGAKPVFCDIDPGSFNIDVAQLESKITDRTRAVIPVHLFGLPAEMEAILTLAEKYGLAIVEDAACGLGAYYEEQHVGNFGKTGCFSFHPRKAITTGEGGMLTTADDEIDNLLRALRNHGASLSGFARHESKRTFLLSEYRHLGFNYRMTDLQGALGVAQMEKIDWIQKQRRSRAAVYDELLGNETFLRLPHCPDNMTHAYQAYVCLYQPKKASPETLQELNEQRNNVMVALEEKGISTRQGTHAVTLQEY
ncbi:MAG: DegT/DnrJ/EryC1/StrS family aminotransferase, partial [Candidatus Zixiibacteriota bacterium]